MGEMSVMGKRGDTKVIWDSENAEEVKAARATFDQLKKNGYLAYSVKKSGEKGRVVLEFDPDAEKIILAPPMSGG